MHLRQLFRILFRTMNHQYDYTFDWTMLKQKTAATMAANSQPQPSSQQATKVLVPGSTSAVDCVDQ